MKKVDRVRFRYLSWGKVHQAGSEEKVSHLGLLNLSDFLFFLGFRVGADDILGIELNFLSIYKATFRTFFPNGGKKQNRKQPPNFFFKNFFSHI